MMSETRANSSVSEPGGRQRDVAQVVAEVQVGHVDPVRGL